MTYEFSPLRYGAIVLGLSVALAAFATLLKQMSGFDIGGGALAVLPLIAGVTLEAKRFSKSVTAAPTAKEIWMLSGKSALTGSVTYLLVILAVLGFVLGPQRLTQPETLAEPLLAVLGIGAVSLFAGFFITRAVVQAALSGQSDD